MNWCSYTPFWDAAACAANAESEEPESRSCRRARSGDLQCVFYLIIPAIARLRANAAGTKSLAAQPVCAATTTGVWEVSGGRVTTPSLCLAELT